MQEIHKKNVKNRAIVFSASSYPGNPETADEDIYTLDQADMNISLTEPQNGRPTAHKLLFSLTEMDLTKSIS